MSIASVADTAMNEQQVLEVLEKFEAVVMTGFDSQESAALRAELREQIPCPPPELARALLPWVEGLLKDLRNIAEG